MQDMHESSVIIAAPFPSPSFSLSPKVPFRGFRYERCCPRIFGFAPLGMSHLLPLAVGLDSLCHCRLSFLVQT